MCRLPERMGVRVQRRISVHYMCSWEVPKHDGKSQVRALREERARQARRQSQVACALITLLVILVVAAVLLIVKLATGWSPQGLLKQAWRSTTAVLPVPRAASGSLRPIARKPWTPLGSMTSLGPPWSAARQWLNEAELEQL